MQDLHKRKLFHPLKRYHGWTESGTNMKTAPRHSHLLLFSSLDVHTWFSNHSITLSTSLSFTDTAQLWNPIRCRCHWLTCPLAMGGCGKQPLLAGTLTRLFPFCAVNVRTTLGKHSTIFSITLALPIIHFTTVKNVVLKETMLFALWKANK